MTDIFLSYAREDEARIKGFVADLERQGLSVFWDRRIPSGETWRSYIGTALDNARCVIVAWSRHSVNSTWVNEEADDAKRRGLLVPVLLDSVEQPRGFREIQAADLTDWQPGSPSERFDELIEDVRRRLHSAGTGDKRARRSAKPSQPVRTEARPVKASPPRVSAESSAAQTVRGDEISHSTRANWKLPVFAIVAGLLCTTAVLGYLYFINGKSISAMIETPSSPEWMKSTQYQQEFERLVQLGLYPKGVEGRCQSDNEEFRAVWDALPRDASFVSHHGMLREIYDSKNQEYGAIGFSLDSLSRFADCSGIVRYQATWLKR